MVVPIAEKVDELTRLIKDLQNDWALIGDFAIGEGNAYEETVRLITESDVEARLAELLAKVEEPLIATSSFDEISDEYQRISDKVDELLRRQDMKYFIRSYRSIIDHVE